jgi:orotidine-5'-phosphate decarboxylase
MHPELIVALDVPDAEKVGAVLSLLPPEIRFFKVGLELYTASGPKSVQILRAAGKHVFLDLKLHDIPRTVARSITTAAQHGVSLLTLHAAGGKDMLRAAADAAAGLGEHRPRLLAVTTLTSLGPEDLRDIGVTRSLAEHTLALGRMAVAQGIDGLICSVHEAEQLRKELGAAPILVTPGIRPAGSHVGDQKRVATPASAVNAGANFLVVGRPIMEADDPAAAARIILDEIAAASTAR